MSPVRLVYTEYDPRRRYTVAEFAALPLSGRCELHHGSVESSPEPPARYRQVLDGLLSQIDAQVTVDWRVFSEAGVIVSVTPPIVRSPDLVISRAGVDHAAPLLDAEQVVLAVEIVSPVSNRVDTTVKPFEYADAGIPQFWLVDPEPPVTVTAYALAGEDYEESQRGEGIFEVGLPCPLRIDLIKLS